MTNTWHTTVYAVCTDRDTRRVWLAGSAHDWTLPHTILTGNKWSIATAGPEVEAALAPIYGAPATVLRRMHYQEWPEAYRALAVFEVETAAAPQMAGAWAGRDALEATASIVRPVLAALFDELDDSVPSNRPMWQQRGARAQIAAWIRAQLAGRASVLQIESLRTWAQSCVLRVHTDAGRFVFKAAADLPLVANEPAILSRLHRAYPARVPQPLAIDAARQWMLLPDLGAPLGWDAPESERVALVQLWAQIQRDSVAHVDSLLGAGFPDRRLPVLVEQFDRLVHSDLEQLGIDARAVARLRAFTPRLREACRRLEASPVRPSLVHGDLHVGNVAAPEGELIIFDWSGACIAHPFVDTNTIQAAHSPAQRQRLCNAYLAIWSDLASAAELQQLWKIAVPVYACHHAVSYHQLVTHIEPSQRQEQLWSMNQAFDMVLRADEQHLS